MKKIISLLSALAIFSSMAVTSFANTYEPSAQAAANSNPVIEGYVDSVASGYAIIKFKLTNAEALSFYDDWGFYTSNGISSLTIKVRPNFDVFDKASSRIQGNYTGASVGGAGTDELTFTFNPSSVDTYMYELPEYFCMVRLKLNAGYDEENIPSNAISYGETLMAYSKYDNSDVRTNFTKYAVNGIDTVDYPLTVKFEGTAEEGGETGATEMVAGVDNITAEAHRGKSSISAPEVVAVADIAKITVENSAEAGRVEEWEAPTTLGNGKTKVLAIVTFDKAAMAGTTFTVKYLNSALEAIKTFTYTVAQ